MRSWIERITRLTRTRGIPVLAALALGPIMIVGTARPSLVAPAHPSPMAPPAIGAIRHLTRAVTDRPAGIVRARGQAGALVSAPDPGRVTYNGGPVEQHPVVYLVFWGPWWYSPGNP